MSLIWIVVLIIVVWWLASRSKKAEYFASPTEPETEEAQAKVTEEMIFKSEKYFENKIETEVDFPDAIDGYSIYVYKNLMRPWYRQLSAENRYNDEMIQRLRSDWIEYVSVVEEEATSGYLYIEERDPEKAETYATEMRLAHEKKLATEDGFSFLIGKKAVKELSRIRTMRGVVLSKFDKYGNLAPDGFKYDHMGELCPEKGK